LNASQLSIVPSASRPAEAASLLGRRKIGIDDQPGAVLHRRLVPRIAQGGACIGGAAVLPDDRARQRLSRGFVPGDHGFALVGDADAGDAADFAQHLARAGQRRAPDLARVMLDPAGLRIVLHDFALRDRPQAPRQLEHHSAGGGRARVQHQDQIAQGYSPQSLPV
jgi:hypothetical protein